MRMRKIDLNTKRRRKNEIFGSSSNLWSNLWLLLILFTSRTFRSAHAFTRSSPLAIWKPVQIRASCQEFPRFSTNDINETDLPTDADDMNAENADPTASLEALDALVPRSKITPLIKSKSNLQGALQILFHLTLFGLAAAIPSKTLSLFGMVFISSFVFHGLHETVHRSAFRHRWINDLWAHVFGFICMRPARHYFYYHWQHHKYTGNPKLDSELQAGSFLDLPIETPLTYLVYLSGVPFWIDAVSSLLRHALGDCSREVYLPTDKARRQVRREARIYLACYSLVAMLSVAYKSLRSQLVRLWVLPALLGQPFLRFYLLAEHRGRKLSPLIYENTRTMSSTNWFYRKLAWNMPYHTEHHAWPSVPFYQLPKAHQLLIETSEDGRQHQQHFLQKGELNANLMDSNNKGYLHFHWAFLKTLFRTRRTA